MEVVREVISAVDDRALDRLVAHCTESIQLETPWAAVEGTYIPALLRVSATGRASGITAGVNVLSATPGDRRTATVYDLADGRVRRIRVFLDRQQALDGVRLRE